MTTFQSESKKVQKVVMYHDYIFVFVGRFGAAEGRVHPLRVIPEQLGGAFV